MFFIFNAHFQFDKGGTPWADLMEKSALVTGASRGIGREIALELAREGAKVALNYQSSDARAQAVADEIAKLGGTCLIAKARCGPPARGTGDGQARCRPFWPP